MDTTTHYSRELRGCVRTAPFLKKSSTPCDPVQSTRVATFVAQTAIGSRRPATFAPSPCNTDLQSFGAEDLPLCYDLGDNLITRLEVLSLPFLTRLCGFVGRDLVASNQ